MQKVFEKAARSALFAWKQDETGAEDLVGDLWVWYLERPVTQEKMEGLSFNEAVVTAKKAALQMLSKDQLGSNEFHGRNLYSSDNVKAALLGKSNNRYLMDILPTALKALEKQNAGYAEALRSRYLDGTIPATKHDQNLLVRAHKSITEHVNVIAITAGLDSSGNLTEGPGSRHAVFPETRKVKGAGHADPTANIAIALIENPEMRDEYLREQPLQEFLGGRGYAQSA